MLDRLRRHSQQELDAFMVASLLIGAFILYLRTLAPTVASIYDDSLEFPVVINRLAIAHPTGYPLYTLLGKLFSFLPVGDVAYRLHLFSALSAALAVALLYVLCRRLDLHVAGALAAALCLAVSPVFWSQALVAEVYALNALFVAAILLLAVEWGRPEGGRFRTLAALVFVSGLSLTHHRTIMLLAPGLLLYMALVYLARRGKVMATPWPRWSALRLCLLFCLPLLLYLYIPIRGMVTSSLDGTYRNTLQGFVSWIAGSSYTSFLSSDPMNQTVLGAAGYLSLLKEQFGLLALALAVVGSAWLVLRRRRAFVLFGLTWLAVVLFVHMYRVYDPQVFVIPSFMMVALAIGAALHALATETLPAMQKAAAWRRAAAVNGAGQPPRLAIHVSRLLTLVALALAVLLPALVFEHNMRALDRHQDWAVHNYAIDVLSQPLEPQANVVGILGEMTLLNYAQETQGVRRDIRTVAADTDEQRLARVEQLMASGEPVYLTRPLPGLAKRYELASVGPLVRVMPTGMAATPETGSVLVQARFGDRISLLSYRLNGLASELVRQGYPQATRPGAVEAGSRLRLSVAWQTAQPVQQSYRVTVRLQSPTGRLLWQTDGAPVHDAYPTSSWRVGETVLDSYDLLVPLGTPPGSYDVAVGMYDAASLQLLSASGRSGMLMLGPVSVVRPHNPVDLDTLLLDSPTAETGLTLPSGQFDYSLASLGVQRILKSNLQNEFWLYGFGLSEQRLTPGQSTNVTLLWQALRAPSGDRVVFIRLVGTDGVVYASQEGQPADGLYATSQWTRDEQIRDIHTLFVPPDVPDGTYKLQAGMYDPSGQPLTVLHLTRRSVGHVDLGIVDVHARRRSTDLPALQHAVNARIGNVCQLAGFDACVGDRPCAPLPELVAWPGDRISLKLVWQAMEPERLSYTVFVHLLDEQNRVVSQVDTVPGAGTLPTSSWVRNEVLQDPYLLAVPPTAAPGLYTVEVGMYDAATSIRLPLWDANGTAIGDSLVLIKVRVELAP